VNRRRANEMIECMILLLRIDDSEERDMECTYYVVVATMITVLIWVIV